MVINTLVKWGKSFWRESNAAEHRRLCSMHSLLSLSSTHIAHVPPLSIVSALNSGGVYACELGEVFALCFIRFSQFTSFELNYHIHPKYILIMWEEMWHDVWLGVSWPSHFRRTNGVLTQEMFGLLEKRAKAFSHTWETWIVIFITPSLYHTVGFINVATWASHCYWQWDTVNKCIHYLIRYIFMISGCDKSPNIFWKNSKSKPTHVIRVQWLGAIWIWQIRAILFRRIIPDYLIKT